MTEIRKFFKSIKTPFFLKKKLILWWLVAILAALIPTLIWTWFNYEAAVESGERIRWKKVADPLAIPLIIATLYLFLPAIWLLFKVKQFKGVAYNTAYDLYTPQSVQLGEHEEKFAEVETTVRISPEKSEHWGVFRVTNSRLMHTQTRSIKRMRVAFGGNEPDLTWSLPWNNIRQCGFGLDEKNPIRFVVIENNGTTHTFVSVYARHLEKIMEQLRWRRMQIEEHVYWVR